MTKKPEVTEEEKAILAARRKLSKAEDRYVKVRSDFRRLVAEYVESGGSPTKIGKLLGVTRGRIYQYQVSWAKEVEKKERVDA